MDLIRKFIARVFRSPPAATPLPAPDEREHLAAVRADTVRRMASLLDADPSEEKKHLIARTFESQIRRIVREQLALVGKENYSPWGADPVEVPAAIAGMIMVIEQEELTPSQTKVRLLPPSSILPKPLRRYEVRSRHGHAIRSKWMDELVQAPSEIAVDKSLRSDPANEVIGAIVISFEQKSRDEC